ncbi:MAG: cupin domain-containing protein [Rhodospirillales bacterium]|nr:cupin domain-containing protein [Rhodospirillales bacterium]
MASEGESRLSAEESAKFHSAMEEARVFALWEQWEGRYAHDPEPPFLWPWKTMEPILNTSINATTHEEGATRRVLCMNRPSNHDRPDGMSDHFTLNLQILAPGEHAPPHRHSIHALRFVLAGGATTVVDGKRCAMDEGDMIITPAWTWHEHLHEGNEPSVWVDGLDVPTHRHYDTGALELGPTNNIPERIPDTAFQASGFTPLGETGAQGHSPMFRYPWTEATKALAAVPEGKDGSRMLRYTDPVTGGAIMNRLDCYLQGLAKGQETIATRSTANFGIVVAEGSGSSRVGESTVHWEKNDVFSVPHGNWLSHTANDSDTKLFMVTDREILRRLELLNEETKD